MEKYVYKYHKYKAKYNNLKKKLIGGNPIGTFDYNNHKYISAISHNDRTYSYYEVNPNLINPNDYTKDVKPNITKILRINDMDTFDMFTNRYAVMYPDGDKFYLRINWDRVSKDFKGFYLDNNNMLKLNRYSYTFYKNKRVTSWMSIEKIPLSVMMFRDD